MAKPKKPKKVSYRFIPPDSEHGRPMYQLLESLVDAHHEDLRDAKIALAWNLSWKEDVDGRVTLGMCKRVDDLSREVADLHAYDFVVILRREFWQDELVTDLQRRALLDHELCHAAAKIDAKTGDQVVDERNRLVWRVRKHDIEEFGEIVDRYGAYKHDLEAFASALDRARAKTAEQWIGYRSLQADLKAAGAAIPLETITTWTEDERREARTWALVRLEPLGQAIEAKPAFLAQALTTAAAEPVAS